MPNGCRLKGAENVVNAKAEGYQPAILPDKRWPLVVTRLSRRFNRPLTGIEVLVC
jgi:hypothetical protein